MPHRRPGAWAVVVLGTAVLAVALVSGITFSQVSGRCSAPTIIGGVVQGFPARATVLDGSTLGGHTDPDHAPQVRVRQAVSVDVPLAAISVNAWVVEVHGDEFIASVDPPPSVAVIDSPPRGVLRPGLHGDVRVNTTFVGKALLTPVAALTPVPGRPDLATVLIGSGTLPPERELRRIEATQNNYALALPTDDDTARRMGVSPTRPDRGWYSVVVPDRLCRVASVWPPVLVEPHFVVIERDH